MIIVIASSAAAVVQSFSLCLVVKYLKKEGVFNTSSGLKNIFIAKSLILKLDGSENTEK